MFISVWLHSISLLLWRADVYISLSSIFIPTVCGFIVMCPMMQ